MSTSSATRFSSSPAPLHPAVTGGVAGFPRVPLGQPPFKGAGPQAERRLRGYCGLPVAQARSRQEGLFQLQGQPRSNRTGGQKNLREIRRVPTWEIYYRAKRVRTRVYNTRFPSHGLVNPEASAIDIKTYKTTD